MASPPLPTTPSTTTTTVQATATTSPGAEGDLELDDILNNALDELDDEDFPTSSSSSPCPPSSSAPTTTTTATTRAQGAAPHGHGDGEAPLAPLSSASTAACSNGHGDGRGGGAAAGGQPGEEDLTAEEKELKETIEKTISMLQRGSEDADLQSGGDDGILNDAFLEQLADEFEKLGTSMKGAAEAAGGGAECTGGEGMVDDMVKHLLCKELMYPPLKQITEQYPDWLESHRGRMEAGMFGRYERQHQLFVQIVEVYERDEGNFNKLLDLMTEVQEYGQPPKEIVEQLLPEGVPAEFSPFGAMAGIPGGGVPGEQCLVM